MRSKYIDNFLSDPAIRGLGKDMPWDDPEIIYRALTGLVRAAKNTTAGCQMDANLVQAIFHIIDSENWSIDDSEDSRKVTEVICGTILRITEQYFGNDWNAKGFPIAFAKTIVRIGEALFTLRDKSLGDSDDPEIEEEDTEEDEGIFDEEIEEQDPPATTSVEELIALSTELTALSTKLIDCANALLKGDR